MKEDIRLIQNLPDQNINNFAPRRTCVLVLGMHRSGTSALTRVLNLLGCDLPKTLMPPTKNNETGHWESTLVQKLNDQILESAGSNWYDWRTFNPDWYLSPKMDEFLEQAVEVVKSEFGNSRLFVLKDPRIARLAPFWMQTLKAVGAKPLIIIPLRNPLEIAESLNARDAIEPALGQLLWLRHVLDAEFSTRGVARIFTSYENLLAGWQHQVELIQQSLGLYFPRLSDSSAMEIDKYLSGSFRHQREDARSVTENPQLSIWLRSTFSILDNWVNKGERTDDYDELDRIRSELNIATPAFTRLLRLGLDAAKQVRKLGHNLTETLGKLTQVEAESVRRQEAVTKLEQELMAARAQQGEGQKKNVQLQSEFERQQQESAGIKTTLTETLGKLTQVESESVRRQEAVTKLEQELIAARAQLGEGQKKNVQLQSEFERQQQESAGIKTTLTETLGKLTQVESESVRRQEAVTKLEQELIAARAQLEEGERKNFQLQAELENQLLQSTHLLKEYNESKNEVIKIRSALAEQNEMLQKQELTISERNKEIQAKVTEIEVLQRNIHLLNASLNDRDVLLNGYKEHIGILISDVNQGKQSYNELHNIYKAHVENKNSELDSANKKLAMVLADRDTLSENLISERSTTSKLISDISTLKNEAEINASEKKQQIENLNNTIKERFGEIEILTKWGLDKDRSINNLEIEVNKINDELANANTVISTLTDRIAINGHEMTELTVKLKHSQDEILDLKSNITMQAELFKNEKATLRHLMAVELGHVINTLLGKTTWWLFSDKSRFNYKVKMLRGSGLFDPDWYLNKYKDVGKAGMNPVYHYLKHGIKEGREPNKNFENKIYGKK